MDKLDKRARKWAKEVDKEFQKMKKPINVELYVLVDKSGQKIYYTGYSEETVRSYMESNCFKDLYVVKLEGELKNV